MNFEEKLIDILYEFYRITGDNKAYREANTRLCEENATLREANRQKQELIEWLCAKDGRR